MAFKTLFSIRPLCCIPRVMDTREWKERVLCSAQDLHLPLTLQGGQTFSWLHHNGLFLGEISDLPILLWEQEGLVYYRSPSPDQAFGLLQSYFRLDYDLADLLSRWKKSDPKHFGKLSSFPAIRWLRQPWQEALFAFICSQNNGIARIHSMVMELKRSFGRHLGDFILTADLTVSLFSFPALTALSDPSVTAKLVSLKFGYRSRYIQQAAKHLLDLGRASESIEELLRIDGVGPKVAACIALFGLGHGQVVPVDVHMWRVAQSKGMGGSKTLTPQLHRMISERFEEMFGPLAGWAHLILFADQRSKGRIKK